MKEIETMNKNYKDSIFRMVFKEKKELLLYEHQSTVNPKIQLRDLFYVTKMYQRLVGDKNIYSRNKLYLPTPQFVVFYNGEEEQPERRTHLPQRNAYRAGCRSGH